MGEEQQLTEAATVSAFNVVDSSRISTFVISILLIVYGSFRSLNLERENKERDKENKEKVAYGTAADNESQIPTIDTCQAMFLPVWASVSLLIMFFFFDSLQMIFAIFTATLGMGLCVAFIALVRLPSLKVSTLLLVGLLVYDVFWVFFSSYIFSTNVMVKVATRPAENPVGLFAKKLHLTGLVRDAPKLSLPAKFVFPSSQHSGNFNMLGLGDIVMPGLLLCFVLRYDMYKKSQLVSAETGVPPPLSYVQRISYFHCSLLGYFLGLLTATVSSEVFRAAQPALLYLVPFTLLPLLTMAYLKGDLRRMWHEPFIQTNTAKHLEV
ncbi:hypothetical protein ACOMHN_051199 [Nucella lapillus]